MSCRIRMLAFASVLFLVAGAAPQETPEQAPPETQPSNEAVASCVLRVQYTKEDLPMNRDSFKVLLGSNAVLAAAAREVPGLIPEVFENQASADLWELNELQQIVGHTPVTTSLLRLTVRVERSVPDADAKAGELLAALSRRLEQVLVERNAGALDRRRQAVAGATEQVTQAERQLGQVQELQRKLYADAGQTDLSRAAILGDLQSMEREQQQVEMKLVGLHARQNALAEQIARIGKEIAERAEHDPVAIELQKVVELRERALQKEKERKDAGLLGSESTAGEEAVAMARAELAKQRQGPPQAAGASLLADLNKEVVTLAVDIAEAEAQGEYLRTRIAQAHERNLLELADRYEAEVAPQLSAAEQSLRDALARRLEAEELVARFRAVTVTVLGGAEE
jgi:hypothetical protein